MPSATADRSDLKSCPECGQALPPGSARCPACGAPLAREWSPEDLVDRIRRDFQDSRLQRLKKLLHGLGDVQYFFGLIKAHPWKSGLVSLGAVLLAGGLWLHYFRPQPDYRERILGLERALAARQFEALKSLQEGERRLDAQDFPGAYAALSRAIASGADDQYSHFLRGLAAAKLGKHQNAIKDFSVVAGLDPENVAALIWRGQSFEGLGSYWQAIRDYRQALNLNSHDAQAAAELYLYQGRAYSRLGDYPQALAALTKAIELGRQGPQVYLQRALLQDRLGHYPEALADYDQALRKDPEMAEALLNRAIIRVKLQHYEEAIPDLNRAVALAPQNSQAYYQRGLAQAHLGNYQKAASDLETAAGLGSLEAKPLLAAVLNAAKQQERSAKQRLVATKTPSAPGTAWRNKPGGAKGKRSRTRRR